MGASNSNDNDAAEVAELRSQLAVCQRRRDEHRKRGADEASNLKRKLAASEVTAKTCNDTLTTVRTSLMNRLLFEPGNSNIVYLLSLPFSLWLGNMIWCGDAEAKGEDAFVTLTPSNRADPKPTIPIAFRLVLDSRVFGSDRTDRDGHNLSLRARQWALCDTGSDLQRICGPG